MKTSAPPAGDFEKMSPLRQFTLLLAPYKNKVLLVFALIFLTNLLSLALPWGLKVVIDEGVAGRDISVLNRLAAGLVLVFILKFFVGFRCEYLINLVGEKAVCDLRAKLYTHLQKLSVQYADKTPKGEILSGILGDIDGIRNFLFGGMVDFAYASLSILFILVVLAVLDWKLALVSLAYLPVFAFAFYRLTPRLTEQYRQARERYAELTSHLHEVLNGLRIVAGFAKEDEEALRFNSKQREIVATTMAGHKLGIGLWMTSELMSSLGLVVLIWFGARAVFAGRITVGTLMAFYAYVGMLLSPVIKVTVVNNYYQEAVASLERVGRLLAEDPKIKEAPHSFIVGRLRGEVRFDNVSFGYDEAKRVLFDINLDVKEGTCIALVGRSGSGKTTLINLLLRFYDPQEGAVLIDGRDLRDLDLKSYRSRIAMVLQDDYLFNASVRENILYGNPIASAHQVAQAARSAMAVGFITQLSKGYDTPIGERGIALSCGQRQRISIARALLRDPALLILDEATSAVDSETERAIVLEAYGNLMRGRTTFIIAHRLSTVVSADRIVVLDDGRITETGSHAGLLAKKGVYWRMWSQQTDHAAPMSPVSFD